AWAIGHVRAGLAPAAAARAWSDAAGAAVAASAATRRVVAQCALFDAEDRAAADGNGSAARQDEGDDTQGAFGAHWKLPRNATPPGPSATAGRTMPVAFGRDGAVKNTTAPPTMAAPPMANAMVETVARPSARSRRSTPSASHELPSQWGAES